MTLRTKVKQGILKELEDLPSHKVEEVLDFIGYLKMKEQNSGADIGTLLLQQRSLRKIWEGEDPYEQR